MKYTMADTTMRTMTTFWYMHELEIGLADVSALNFDQYFWSLMQRKN